MRHLTILLSACCLWALPFSLFAQKTSDALAQAQWLMFEENYSEAQTILQKALQQKKKDSDIIFYHMGMMAIEMEDYPKAKALFKQQIEGKEKSPYCWAGLGNLYAIQKDVSYAEFCIKKAQKYGKQNKLDLHLAIKKASHNSQPDKNADWRLFLVQMIHKYPHEISPKIELFQYYQKKEIYEPAIAIGQEILPLVPQRASIYVQMAELSLIHGKKIPAGPDRGEVFKNAYRYVQEAFADSPGFPDAYRVRAELYIRSNFPGRFQKARDDMAVYLKLKEQDTQAQIQYAKFLFLTEDYQESLNLIQELQGQGIKDKVLLRLQSISLMALGKPHPAKIAMDKYFEQVKPAYRISRDYENYGDILRNLYTPDRAQSYYQLAIDLDETRVSLYGELADEYYDQARVLARQRYQIRNEGKASSQVLSALINTYNSIAKKGGISDTDKAKSEELLDEINLLKDGLEILAQTLQEYEDREIDTYKKEAYYREKALSYEDGLSMRNQRRYADALFNSQDYDRAEQAYIKVHELKEDYLYPYEKRLQIALRQARSDGNEGPGIKRAVPVSQDIIRIFLPKVDELKEKQKKSVLIALESMAVYSFDPEGKNDCQAAQPYLAELKGLNQAYLDSQDGLKAIDGFCEE